MPEFECATPITVTVRLGSGFVDVIAEERTTALVEVSPFDHTEAGREAASNTRVEFRGEELAVAGPERVAHWLWRRSPRLRVLVRVPSASQLVARVGSADVRARGHYRLVDINLTSGDAHVEHVTGDMHVNTASGDLTVERIDGALHVISASGDVAVHRIDGTANLRAASGDIELGQASGQIRVTTASGDIGLDQIGRGEVVVRAASGDVSIGVAAGTGVWLDLGTSSGDVRNDLAMTPTPTTGADLRLEVHTMSGDIHVGRVAVNAYT
jgi:hypothetical protein